MQAIVFSSSELVAQVSFSDRNFHIFIQKSWVNFSQTWLKASLDGALLILLKGHCLFQKEMIAKYIENFKNLIVQLKGHALFQREIIVKLLK